MYKGTLLCPLTPKVLCAQVLRRIDVLAVPGDACQQSESLFGSGASKLMPAVQARQRTIEVTLSNLTCVMADPEGVPLPASNRFRQEPLGLSKLPTPSPMRGLDGYTTLD